MVMLFETQCIKPTYSERPTCNTVIARTWMQGLKQQ